MVLTHRKLKAEYAARKLEAMNRLDEFLKNSRHMTDKDLFVELCFCICTPQSKAKKVAEVINSQNAVKILNLTQIELADMLRTHTRFHNNKAKHIINARKYLKDIVLIKNKRDSSADYTQAREFLVKNIKGIGYKEASHFLRNIGYRNLCIVDRHVINLMHELGVFKNNLAPTTPKSYLQMEEQIKKYAQEHGYDVDVLDLVLWSIRTGYVFR